MLKQGARIVILTGAGISAESGLKTFRDSDGLWEGHRVEDVATPEAWHENPERVLDFYNQRRKALLVAEPNLGHRALVRLEEQFEVTVITQNIDDLHERAGSKHVLHLHGELRKSRSSIDPLLVYEISGSDLTIGEKCEKGSQLRPDVVWFGEAVPMIELATRTVAEAECLIIVGTSLVVYPAASLVNYVSRECLVLVIDPKCPALPFLSGLQFIEERASTGVKKVVDQLLGLIEK